MNNFEAKFEFFASANGQNGFKSYFSEIFNSEDYSKIFVLKGGPGSGKSTLMKKVARFAEERGLNYEVFRCSSDINSLDAVIINSGEKRIAVLDGTAPHERDAKIPGAVDELINLGVAWSVECLERERAKIEELNAMKSECYIQAYAYLRNYSVFARNIKAEIKKYYNSSKLKEAIKKIINSGNFKSDSSGGVRLVSSFSKDGYRKLPTLEKVSSRAYYVFGEHCTDKIFITALAQKLSEMGVKFTKVPSPIDEELLEAIYFRDSGTYISCGCEGEILYDTTELFEKDDYMLLTKKASILEGSMKIYSELAKDEFLGASEYHFKLEEIYKSAVDFKTLDKICENLIFKIEKTLL